MCVCVRERERERTPSVKRSCNLTDSTKTKLVSVIDTSVFSFRGVLFWSPHVYACTAWIACL